MSEILAYSLAAFRSASIIHPCHPGPPSRTVRSPLGRVAASPPLPPAVPGRYIPVVTDLTPIESEFATSEDAAAHDAWFRAKVERAMASTQPGIPHDEVMAMARKIIDRHRAE